jgi:hypothetical protein
MATQLSGLDVGIDEKAIQAAGIELQRPVSLEVSDMDAKSALDLLLEGSGLTYVLLNEAIFITPRQ